MTLVRTEPALARPQPSIAEAAINPSYRWVAASIIALGAIASILSSTVVNVAVPTLQRVFNASLTDIQWISTAYLLGLSAVIPISGWVVDRFGSKRTYMTTLSTFVLASLLCGFATSTSTEIAFRVVQGMAGGMVMPVGMTMLMRLTPPHERGRMMGVFGIPMMVAPALGPTVAGWILQHFEWPYIFWMNVPFCLLALGFAALKLKESERVPGGRLDVIGLLLCTPGVTVFIYGVTKAASAGWTSTAALVPMVAGAMLTAVFVLWELRQKHPLLEIRVFKDAAFGASILVSNLVVFSVFGALFVLPLFMQTVQGYSALSAGTVMAAQGFGSILALPIGGFLTDRFGARPVVITGLCALVLVTLGMTQIQPDTTRLTWALLFAGRGVTSGFVLMPSFSAAYLTIKPSLISRATALTNTLQRMTSSLGVAGVATISADRIAANLPHTRASVSVIHLAIARGIDQALLITLGMTLLALPAALFLRRALPAGVTSHPSIPPAYRALAIGFGVLALLGLSLSVVIAFGLS